MIEIRLSDLHLVEKDLLRKTAKFLLDIAGDVLIQTSEPEQTQTPIVEPVVEPATAPIPPVVTQVPSPPLPTRRSRPAPKSKKPVEHLVPPPPASIDFPTFMSKIVKLDSAGIMSRSEILAIVQAHGVEGLPILATRPDLLPLIADAIDVSLAARGKNEQ